DVAPEEVHIRQHDHCLDLSVLRQRRLQQVARAVELRGVFVILRDQRARRLHGRLGERSGGGRGREHGEGYETREHRANSSTLTAQRPIHDPRGVIAVGVQTWGTDVAALRRYWAAADALGYARVTYGDGLWDFTHDGWTLLAALALQTRTCRIGPAVTYAFAAAAHHPSWLAKRAVAIDPLSGGRLDLRFAVGADGWETSFLPPAAFADAVARFDAALIAAGRPGDVVRRSVEVDAALADAPHEAARAAERFRAHRGLARAHPLLDAALVGDAEAV